MKEVIRCALELNDMGAGGQGTLMCRGKQKDSKTIQRST